MRPAPSLVVLAWALLGALPLGPMASSRAAGQELRVAQATGPANLAIAMARIGQLEEEIRRLRGQVERLEYEQRQMQSFIDDKVAEMERRLTTARAEPETPVGIIAPAVNPPATATGRPPPPQASTAAPPAAVTDPSARRGYVLGTIPADAVRSPAPPPTATAALPPGNGSATPAARYAAARELLRKSSWAEAEAAFKRFIEDFPADPQASNAAYWLGETYFVRQDWSSAAATFARNYSAYGASVEKAPDNLLKLGMSLNRLGDSAKACQTYDELARRHANASPAIKQVLTRERAVAGCG